MQIPMDHSSLSKPITILAGSYFDSSTCEFAKDQLISVCPARGIILAIRPFSSDDELRLDSDNTIDLRELAVLPGFVDTHVHFFLHPYNETSWEDQVTRESIVERTVRAVTHARKTLLAGFTSVRDLGTEGAGDADISLRKCLSGPNPLIPGPRYFCANRALATTGSYGPKGVHNLNVDGVEGITGAEVVDGKDECRKAVRRQIGAGTDWIKIYADYRVRSRMSDVSSRIASKAISTFHRDEIQEIIMTANELGVKTAVHLNDDNTAADLLTKCLHYPHSLEHGSTFSPKTLETLRDRGIYWIPTLAAYYSFGLDSQRWVQAKETFQRALKLNPDHLGNKLKIACGGDTGVFPHGENALEMKLMFQLGADWKQVLQWATLSGWYCVRGMQWDGSVGRQRLERIERLEELVDGQDNDIPFGAIRKGWAADIIATSGNLENGFENAVSPESISFVMKGGKIFKRGGRELV